MEDERLVVGDRQHLGQVRLRRPDVDVRVAVVAEDPERAVEVEVDRRRLEVGRVVRPDRDLAGLERGPDVAIGEDAHRPALPALPALPVRPLPDRSIAIVSSPRSAYRLSTSRLSASRSSKLW